MLAKHSDLLLEPVVLGCKAHSSLDAVGSPATGASDGVVIAPAGWLPRHLREAFWRKFRPGA